MAIARPGKLELNVPALLERLSDSLYERPHVAIRELIQNAHDAIVLLQSNPAFRNDPAYRGEITISLASHNGMQCLVVQDNGIGMSEDELRSELSVIGQSQKPEQLEQLVKGRGQDGNRLIGQYGIGFLASFLIGSRIDVYTRKIGRPEGEHWWCEGNEDYFIEPYQCDFVHGTKVQVTYKQVHKLPNDLLEIDGIKRVARGYAALLRVPVYVKDSRVNRYADHWVSRSRFKEAREDEFKEFLQERFPVEFLDLFRVDAAYEHEKLGLVQYRAAFLIGHLAGSDFLLRQSDPERGGIDVYVKGMFVSRTWDLMPSWASFVHGAIDISNLNLSLSRESIRKDEYFEAVQADLGRRVINRLHDIRGTEKLSRIVDIHSHDLFAACLLHGNRKLGNDQQTFLDDMSTMLPFTTTHGDMTISNYLQAVEDASQRFRRCAPNVIYCLMQKTSGAGESMLAEDMGWPVMMAVPVERKVLDAYVVQHPDISLQHLNPEDLFQLLATDAATAANGDEPLLRAFFEEQLTQMSVSGVEARVKSFRPSTPALLLSEGEQDQEFDRLINEFVEHEENSSEDSRLFDIFRRYAQKKKQVVSKRYLYLNSSNRIIQLVTQLLRNDPRNDNARLACRTIYNSAYLQSAHGALDRKNATIVVENFNDTLQRVLELSLRPVSNNQVSQTNVGGDKHQEKPPVDGEGKTDEGKPYIFFVHSFSDEAVLSAVVAAKELIEREFKIKAVSADEEVRALTVPANVKALIRSCDFAIADISGNNPNVMLEIGMLDMLGKKVVKIRNSADKTIIPIDIGSDLYCQYEAIPSTRETNRIVIDHRFIDKIRDHIRHALS